MLRWIVSLRSCMICTISESRRSMRRFAPSRMTMAERQIRMMFVLLKDREVCVSYRRTHRDNQQRNQSVHQLHQLQNDHIPNQRNRSWKASFRTCTERGLMQSFPLVDACPPAEHRCKGRCRCALSRFCSCIYNTRFPTLCQKCVPPIQPSTGGRSVCVTFLQHIWIEFFYFRNQFFHGILIIILIQIIVC